MAKQMIKRAGKPTSGPAPAMKCGGAVKKGKK